MNNIFLRVKKWSLLLFLAIGLIAFFYFDLFQYLNFHTLKTYQYTAQQWTESHYYLSVLIYLAVFILLLACAIPCATLLTLIGGFLFGVLATLYASIAITIGGLILFLAVRTALGSGFTKHASPWIKRMEKGFQKNAFNYLLLLRLIPVLPCWVSNVSAGALNIPVHTFLLATFLGVFPSTLIYVLVGRGLDKFFAADQVPDLSILLTPSILFPLIGLAFLSIFPVFYKSIKKNPNRQ